MKVDALVGRGLRPAHVRPGGHAARSTPPGLGGRLVKTSDASSYVTGDDV